MGRVMLPLVAARPAWARPANYTFRNAATLTTTGSSSISISNGRISGSRATVSPTLRITNTHSRLRSSFTVPSSSGLRSQKTWPSSLLLSPSSSLRRMLSELPKEKQQSSSDAEREQLLQHRSNQSTQAIHNTETSSKPIIERSIEAARERTKAVSDKVRASLTTLTPHENIYNLPNLLTVTRLFAAPTTAYLLLHDHHKWALALFAYAGFTDLLDGWLARRWKLQTVAGSVIDPMADKALMIILTVTLAVKGALPAYLATLILGRDASLAIAAIYYRYASLPAPKTLLRYWDFSLPSAEVHPTTVSKYNTFLQLILIGSTLALPVVMAAAVAADASAPSAAAAAAATTASAPSFSSFLASSAGQDAVHATMTYFQYLVTATTVWSGFSYAVLRNAVTILGTNEALKAKQGARGRAIIGASFGAVVLAAAWLAATRRDETPTDDGDGDGGTMKESSGHA